MIKALVLYYSRTGTTESMAKTIAQTLREENVTTDLCSCEIFALHTLPQYHLIIIGSPTYYGTMAGEIKKVLDESVKFHGELKGKIGGAFTSSGNPAGGNETTLLSILSALLIHGMIIQGMPENSHYGPVAIGGFSQSAEGECQAYARELAKLAKSLWKG
ncbi:MAG: flavodoxin family protein [Candidatus Caldatribacteriaceae bacterium]